MSSKNAAMAIWLGKQYLGQKDVIYNENELGGKTLDSLDKYLEAKESDDADGAFKP